MSTKRIIILGGGFGGVKCAEMLRDPARVGALGAPCLAGTGCARLRQAKRAQQRLVDPGQLSANTLIARTQGVEVTAMMSLSKETSKAARFAICLSHQNCRIHSKDGSLSWKASKACGCGLGESTSRDRRSSFLAGTARPLATRPSTHASSSPASARGCRSFPPIPCGIRPPRSFSTSAEPTCATCRPSWAIRVSQQPRATRTSIASGCARSWETSGCTRSRLFFPMSQVRPKGERVGEIAAKAVVQLLFATGKSFTALIRSGFARSWETSDSTRSSFSFMDHHSTVASQCRFSEITFAKCSIPPL